MVVKRPDSVRNLEFWINAARDTNPDSERPSDDAPFMFITHSIAKLLIGFPLLQQKRVITVVRLVNPARQYFIEVKSPPGTFRSARVKSSATVSLW